MRKRHMPRRRWRWRRDLSDLLREREPRRGSLSRSATAQRAVREPCARARRPFASQERRARRPPQLGRVHLREPARTSAARDPRSARRSGESLAAASCSASVLSWLGLLESDPRGQRASQRWSARGTGRRRRNEAPSRALRPNGSASSCCRARAGDPRRGERPACSRRLGRRLARSTASSLAAIAAAARDRRPGVPRRSTCVRQSRLTAAALPSPRRSRARGSRARGRPRICRRGPERAERRRHVRLASTDPVRLPSSSLHSAIASAPASGRT